MKKKAPLKGGTYMKILTVDQMKTEERLSDEMGVTYQRLMENAGCAAAAFIRRTLSSVSGRNFMIFCGSGNNAGDGYVIALEMAKAGLKSTLLLLGDKFSDDGLYYYVDNVSQKTRFII